MININDKYYTMYYISIILWLYIFIVFFCICVTGNISHDFVDKKIWYRKKLKAKLKL